MVSSNLDYGKKDNFQKKNIIFVISFFPKAWMLDVSLEEESKMNVIIFFN